MNHLSVVRNTGQSRTEYKDIDRLIGLVERGETLRVKHVFAA